MTKIVVDFLGYNAVSDTMAEPMHLRDHRMNRYLTDYVITNKKALDYCPIKTII